MVEDGVAGPPAKKRGATRQISKEDGSDSEGEASGNLESGTFQKASEQVMARRRFVKVRRSGASAVAPPVPNPFTSIRLEAPTTTTPAQNPFAAISLVAPMATTSSSMAPMAPPISTSEVLKVAGSGNVTDGPTDVQEEKPVVAKAKAEQGNGKPDGGSVTEAEKQVLESVVTPKGVQHEGLDVKSKDECLESIKPISADVQNESLDFKPEIEGPEPVNTISGDGKGPKTTVQTENGEEEEPTVHKGDNIVKECEGNRDDEGKDKVEIGQDGSIDKGVSKNSCPPLGSTNHRPFSFGTTPSAFEAPTAFASFSSTWAAFGSNNTSGTGLGSGFAWNKAASMEGASGLVSTAFGSSCNPSSFQLFSTQPNTTPSITAPSSNPPPTSIQFQGGSTQTGEEQEKLLFGADATLFEFVEGSWKERGKGELRVNAPIGNDGTPRLLMRSRGNFRLILNASIFPDMKMTAMDSRGVTFACVNSAVEEREGLATYAVKFKDSLSAGNFRDVVEAQRHPPAQGGLKTPENSPTAVHGA